MSSPRLGRARSLLALDSNVLALSVTSLFATFGNSLWIFLLSIYLLSLGLSVPLVGVTFALAAGASASANWISGILVDRVGRKPMLTISSLAGGLLLIGMGLTTTAPLVAAGYIGYLFTSGAHTPARQAMIADSVGPERRATAIGSWQTIAGSAAVFGPALGGYVWAHYSFAWLLLIGGILYLAVALLRQIWLEERWQRSERSEVGSHLDLKEGLRSIQGNPLLMLLVAIGVVNAIFATMSSFLAPIFAQRTLELGPVTIGFMFSVLAVAYLVAAIPGGKLAERIGPFPVVVATGLLSVVPETAFLFSAGAGAALGAFGLWTGMDALGGPAFSAWSLNLSRSDRRGSVQGTLYALEGLATVPIPLMAALLYSVQARLPFELDILVTVALFGLLWAYGRRRVSDTPVA